MAQVATKADPAAGGWAMRDPVIRLRIFGTGRTFDLRRESRWVLGTSLECSIRLEDPHGRVSRTHAVLQRDGDDWSISDSNSTNGIRQDGEDRKSFLLAPGTEIELGGVKLIAESERSIQLHELLSRLVGWSPTRTIDVDRALRAVRDMANLRATLVLRGDGSLAGTAARIHRIVLDGDRPLSIHAPDEPGMKALARATDGSLYLDAERLPDDMQHVAVSLRLPDARVRLMVGANSEDAAATVASFCSRIATISIPSFSERDDEIDRLLEAYGTDAVNKLAAPAMALRPHDLRWIRESGIKTLAEAEDVMLRVVAMRNWGVTNGAERLGITHGALSRWARRRKIPT